MRLGKRVATSGESGRRRCIPIRHKKKKQIQQKSKAKKSAIKIRRRKNMVGYVIADNWGKEEKVKAEECIK